jgi:hypothetical protein
MNITDLSSALAEERHINDRLFTMVTVQYFVMIIESHMGVKCRAAARAPDFLYNYL